MAPSQVSSAKESPYSPAKCQQQRSHCHAQTRHQQQKECMAPHRQDSLPEGLSLRAGSLFLSTSWSAS